MYIHIQWEVLKYQVEFVMQGGKRRASHCLSQSRLPAG